MTSSRTAGRLNRILAMLPWVIANPGATVNEVCTRFGYTERELAADLDLVFVCGLPGYGPGDLMVAYVDEDEVVVEMADYFSRPLRLTPYEALELLAAGRALDSAGAAPEALGRALDKLQAVVFPDADDSLVVDLGEPMSADDLRRAVAGHRVVEITYTALASGETTTRQVEPWRVFSTLGNWYLSGYCRRAAGERVFRVDRIRDVTVLEEEFGPPEQLPEPVVRYTPGEDDVRARIRLGPRARWVVDYYPVDVVEDTDDGPLTVVFSTSDAGVAARLLARLGGDAELLEGEEVARALDDLRRRILGRYTR